MTGLHDRTDTGVARARLARQFITTPVKDSVAGLERAALAAAAERQGAFFGVAVSLKSR